MVLFFSPLCLLKKKTALILKRHCCYVLVVTALNKDLPERDEESRDSIKNLKSRSKNNRLVKKGGMKLFWMNVCFI